jgi:hypothetical protein
MATVSCSRQWPIGALPRRNCPGPVEPDRTGEPPLQCGLGHEELSNRQPFRRQLSAFCGKANAPDAAAPIWPARHLRVSCEPNHPHFYSLSSRGGRVLPVIHRAGAVGANPPQESLRPKYRCGEATLESSQACSGSPTVQADDRVRGISQVQYRAGRNPTDAAPHQAGQTWSSS